MRLVITLALFLTSLAAYAQQMPQPSTADLQQAGAGTAAELSSLVVSLRAQLLADQRRIAELEAASKPMEAPKP